MQGKFIGIGVGPGDELLLTVKAVQTIETLDLLYAPQAEEGEPSLAQRIAQTYIPEHVMVVNRHFPMVRDKAKKEEQWQSVSAEIAEHVQNGKRVGFLTLGDPNTYSTFSYILERLPKELATEIIPGITSFAQIASILQKPLVIDEENFCVVAATSSSEVISNALQHFDNIIIMKIKRHLKKVLPLLEEYGLTEQAVIVSNASQANQKVFEDITQLDPEIRLSYFSTMIINKRRNQ